MTIKLAYSINEAAAATGIGPDTIRAATRSGRLKAKRQSVKENGDGVGKVIILAADLQAWLESLQDA